MFISRFFLGLGIGPKSATTPIYAAECAPPKLRGALVMVSSQTPSPISGYRALTDTFSNGKCASNFQPYQELRMA